MDLFDSQVTLQSKNASGVEVYEQNHNLMATGNPFDVKQMHSGFGDSAIVDDFEPVTRGMAIVIGYSTFSVLTSELTKFILHSMTSDWSYNALT